MYDLIIVGGGPAALTAAVYVARKKMNALLIAQDLGGQPNLTDGVENYMGYQYIEGPELMRKFTEQVSQFHLEQKIGLKVVRVSREGDDFKVATAVGETFTAHTVIVATGKRSKELGAPGEKEHVGRGVSYCSVCDGPVFAGRRVAVIGGGNSALEAALDMARIAEHTYLIARSSLTADAVLTDQFKVKPRATVLAGYEVLEITGQALVDGIRTRDIKGGEEKTLAVAGVFIEVGLTPNSEPVAGLAALNRNREIIVTPSCETNVPGLFAAGDVTDVPEKQIVIAAGEGAKAALQAHRYLQRLGQAILL